MHPLNSLRENSCLHYTIWLLFLMAPEPCSPCGSDVVREENFIKLYGNDPKLSGLWEEARNISTDEDRLKEICMRAHKNGNRYPADRIVSAAVEQKTVEFYLSRYKPITADTIVYEITTLPHPHCYLRICKGLRPDCVFYLIPWSTNGTNYRLAAHVPEFRMGSHVCGTGSLPGVL